MPQIAVVVAHWPMAEAYAFAVIVVVRQLLLVLLFSVSHFVFALDGPCLLVQMMMRRGFEVQRLRFQ
jgi:hypothetical protein